MLALGLAIAVAPGAAWASAAAPATPRVVVAVLPAGTTVAEIGSVSGLAPGVVSAGLGPVPLEQTYLDMSQGNRVNETLYDGDLPPLIVRGGAVPAALWDQVVARADSAPADVVPGLLASTVKDAGIAVAATPGLGLPTLIAIARDGTVEPAGPSACRRVCPSGLTVTRASIGDLEPLIAGLDPEDMLIAVAANTAEDQKLLPIGIAAESFGTGNLTSASTRTDGVVTSTDLAPTILDRLGVEIPNEINGSEITATGERDPAAVADLQSRLDHRPSRDAVVLAPLGVWLLVAALAAALSRGRAARPALRLLALACVWTPAILLLLAAPDASEAASVLAVGLGAPLLAVLTDRLIGGCAGLALACAVTVGGYAIDVVAGSPLTALSVLGPNPGGGVRFFGIGNELEAILTTLTVVGTGAALEAGRRPEPRRAAIWFVAVAIVVAAALAPGRFGADVGAAIVLGVGAATAAVLAAGIERRRAILYVVGGGFAALVALFAIDLIGGGAHLSRSVLGAGQASDVVDVLDRRLRLMTATFIHPVYPQLLVICAALLVAALIARDRLLGWFGDRWAARSGYLGAGAGVLVGTLANDSGSVLLVLGTIYLAVLAGFFWATGAPRAAEEPETAPARAPAG
jgi:hypothetical protein